MPNGSGADVAETVQEENAMRTVRDFMTLDPVTVQVGATLGEAARLMRDRQIGLLPVMDGDRLVGVVTDRDLVVRGLTELAVPSHVGAICTQSVTTIRPESTEVEAADAMEAAKVRRLPVAHRGVLVGIVSIGDLAVRADSRRAGEVLEFTGPSPDQMSRGGVHWPGEELTRNTLSNADSMAEVNVPNDIQRDITQAGTHPTA